MNRRSREKQRVLAILTLLLAGIVWAGCSSDSDDEDDDITVGASSFAGAYATNVDSGSFEFKFGSMSVDSTLGVMEDGADLSATIVSATFGTLVVPGTWNEEINDLRLENSQGSAPLVQILGSFDGDVFVGITSADLGFGTAVAVPDDGGSARTYCGTFTRTTGEPGGRFNLVVGSGIAYASVFDDFEGISLSLSGSAGDGAISLEGDGVEASGTTSGSSVSGTWSNVEGEAGDWSGSTGDCGLN